jgi:ABC-type Fe3+/spermidine/putrescine transport system ATPase subunit
VLFVTHDLDEAFTLADRLVVIDRGTVRGIGSPTELLRSPGDRSVARLLGVTNLLTGDDVDPECVSCSAGELRVDPARRIAPPGCARSTWAIHPDHVDLIHPGAGSGSVGRWAGDSTEWTAVVIDRRRRGTRTVVRVDAAGVLLTATVAGHDAPEVGTTVRVRLPVQHLSEVSDA